MFFHARRVLRRPTPGDLRLQLRRLRAVSEEAQEMIRGRRRRIRGTRQQFNGDGGSGDSSAFSSTASYSGLNVEWLPRNDALESAIALAISENRDARTELEFTRHFLNGSFLSLASPVGPWDPYDTKPQVFALDKYIALPVFTSLQYLRLFCRRFHFTVRDPSGMLWADGPADEAAEDGTTDAGGKVQLLPDVTKSEWWGRYTQMHRATPALLSTSFPVAERELLESTEKPDEDLSGSHQAWVNADDLFEAVDTTQRDNQDVSPNSEKKRCARSSGQRRRRLKKNRRKKASSPVEGDEEVSGNESATTGTCDSIHDAFWAKVRSTAPFQIKQATPLPVFGTLLHPFFVGYFADTDTLLHNASIVPEKVDIVLNPTSPIEFVLAREATDRVLQKDELLFLAYRRVEKELRGEFHRFLCHAAPEVEWARSACIPSPVPGELDAVRYELVILLQSDNIDRTFSCLHAAKQRALLMGHSDLDVLPWDAAAPHVREASTLFYERSAFSSDAHNTRELFGVFKQRGLPRTVHMTQSAESFYHDPTAAYTESHAVFTEELKLKRHMN